MARGRSSRYSEPKPWVVSVTSPFHPAARVKLPAAILKPSSVITSSPVWARAPAVEIVVLVVATATVWDPLLSSGATVAAPDHSVIWATPPIVAGFIVKVALGMPPGLFGQYQISLRPSPTWSAAAAEIQPAGAPNWFGVSSAFTVASRRVPAWLTAGVRAVAL